MNREQLDDMLVDYLYGELTPAERTAFEAAAAVHPDLAAQISAHLDTREAMLAYPVATLPASLRGAILSAAASEPGSPLAPAAGGGGAGFFAKLSQLLMRPAFATGMAAVVILGVGVLLMQRAPSSSEDPNAQRVAPVAAKLVPPAGADDPAPPPTELALDDAAPAPMELAPADDDPRPKLAEVLETAEAEEATAIGDDRVHEGAATNAPAVTRPARAAVRAPTLRNEASKGALSSGSSRGRVFADDGGTLGGLAGEGRAAAGKAVADGYGANQWAAPDAAKPARATAKTAGAERRQPTTETSTPGGVARAVRDALEDDAEAPAPAPTEDRAQSAGKREDATTKDAPPAEPPPARKEVATTAPSPAADRGGQGDEGAAPEPDPAVKEEAARPDYALDRVETVQTSGSRETRDGDGDEGGKLDDVADLWVAYQKLVDARDYEAAEKILDRIAKIEPDSIRTRRARAEIDRRRAAGGGAGGAAGPAKAAPAREKSQDSYK